MSNAPKYRAPALDKGLDILELLSRNSKPLNITEIASGVGYSKGEIFRMLQVLEDRKYITRGEGDTGYLLTNRLFMLGMERPQIKGLVEVALPIMRRLSDEILHPCHLVVVSEDQIVVIARVDSPSDLGFVVRVGHRRPVTHSTSGLVLFAFQSPEVRAQWLNGLDVKHNSFKRKVFIERAEEVRKRGFASCPSETIEWITDISAPILQHNHAVGALTIPFIDRPQKNASMNHAIERLRIAVDEISQKLPA